MTLRAGDIRHSALCLVAAVLAVWLGLQPSAAEARSRAYFSIGVPLYLGPPAYYYPPPPPVYYYPPPPPPVYYAPPPAAYAPPPVAYVPPAPAAPAMAQTCREYQSTVTINGTPQATFGTACLQPDGSWRIVR
jgi:hypothetical protein